MGEIRTGMVEYYKRIIVTPIEVTFARQELEEKIKEYEDIIKVRKRERDSSSNIERLERVVKTAKLLISGYSIDDIAAKLDVKRSTAVSYVDCLRGYQHGKGRKERLHIL